MRLKPLKARYQKRCVLDVLTQNPLVEACFMELSGVVLIAEDYIHIPSDSLMTQPMVAAAEVEAAVGAAPERAAAPVRVPTALLAALPAAAEAVRARCRAAALRPSSGDRDR